jgi:ATP-dependent RNA helicase DDX3X
MSDSGDPAEVGAATTNGGAITDAEARKEKELQENLQAVQDKGWTNPIPFVYDSVTGGTAAPDETRDEAPWLSDAAVYEWDDEFGDVAPRVPKLEKELYESETAMRAGKRIEALKFEVKIEGPTKIQAVRDVSSHLIPPTMYFSMLTKQQFEDAGLHPAMLENVKLCRYDSPTPIQAFTIPAVLTGHDVVGVAQTGMDTAFECQ